MTKKRGKDLSSKDSIQHTPRRRTGPQCKAHRKNGERCKNPPIRGAEVCRYHGGGSKFARDKANERLLEMVMPALNRIRRIILNPKTSDEVALKAAREILNRTGFSERFALTVGADTTFEDVIAEITEDRSGIAIEGGDSEQKRFALEKAREDANREAWSHILDEESEAFERSKINSDGHRVVDGEVLPHPTTDGGPFDGPEPPLGPSEFDR
jgi:hypothetical protein